MNEHEIKSKYQLLSDELKGALSTMEHSDKVRLIHSEIKELQNICPHKDNITDYENTEKCPFCGKKFRG